MPPITTTFEDDLAVVSMDDGKANAMNLEFLSALSDAFDEVARSEALAVALLGRPRFFSGGIDLKAYAGYDEQQRERHTRALAGALMKVFAFGRPVVAGVTGHAIAGGALLAFACDLRVMAPEVKIGTNEVALGVNVPDFGLAITEAAFPRHMYTELLLHGTMLPSQEALKYGLVSEVVEYVSDRAKERARQLAKSVGRDAYEVTKKRIRQPIVDRAMATLDRDIAGFVRGVTALARPGK